MEGGNKQQINLEAGLDIKSSDMLVPIGQNTFQHNWQKYQGRCLPNSLRFEKNGWAAGWNVYNFDYSVFRKDYGDFWLGVKDFNMYVKELDIYATEHSYDPIDYLRVVPEAKLVSGDVTIAGNTITGKIKGNTYQLNWDPDTGLLTCVTPGFTVEQTNNSDLSITAKVIDIASQVSLDFELLIPVALTGDSVSRINYSGFDGTVHSWNTYKYNPNTNTLVTPEGVSVNPTVNVNELTFDYNLPILDETIDTDITLSKYYVEFTNCYVQDYTNQDEFKLTAAPAPATMSCNNYAGDVDPKDLVVRDPEGIIIDYALPVWLTVLARPDRPNPEAIKCNNCKNNELLVFVRDYPLNIPVKIRNAYTGNLISVNTTKEQRYLNDAEYRFNQVYIGNTIHKPWNWHWSKYKIPTVVWNAENRQYENFRNKNTTLMDQYLGSIYTWGTFTFSMADAIEYNKDPTQDMDDENNKFYTESDISSIYSIKKKGDPDTDESGDDFEVAQDALDNSTIDLSKLIYTAVGETTNYDPTQQEKEYGSLYSGGKYVGGTYETRDTDANWPFGRVPKFNYKDPDGNITTGVFYVYPDKTTVVTDLDEFKKLVRGEFDPSIDPQNKILVDDPDYNRTREVRRYNTGYDFDYIHQEEDESQSDWSERRDEWNEPWEKYYPSITSPIDKLDWHDYEEDNTFLDWTDINVVWKDSPLKWIVPGQYMIDKYAIQYNNNMGIIIHEDAIAPIKAEVWHNTVNATSRYNVNARQESGKLTVDGLEKDIWDYFGPDRYFQAWYNANPEANMQTGWIQNNTQTHLESSGFKVGVNYDFHVIAHYYAKESDGSIKRDSEGNPIESTRDLGINDDTLRDPDAEFHTIRWDPTEMADNNWVDQMLFNYRSGVVLTEDYVLNSKLDPTSSDGHETKHGDQNDGVFYCVPLLGHTATRITYPKLTDATKINETNPSPFILEKVPDDQLPDPDKLYIDREGGINELMFNIECASVEADKSDGTGAFRVQAKAASDIGKVFYTVIRKDNENNEIYWDYYLTGLCYGSADNKQGHIATLGNDFPCMEVIWQPQKYDLPITCLSKFSNKNTKGTMHKFYNNAVQMLSPTTECDPTNEFDFENLTVPIHFTLTNGVTWDATFDARTGVITSEPGPVLYDDPDYSVNALTTVGLKVKCVTALSIALAYRNNKAKFPMFQTVGYTMTGADPETVSFDFAGKHFKYSFSSLDLVSHKADTQAIVEGELQHVIAKAQDQDIVTAYLPTVNGTIVTFTYQGNTYTFDLNELQGASDDVDVTSVDVRRCHVTKNIGRLKQQGNYQLVRQAWNSTVEVEDFWWVDAKHILELNQTHFVLKRNTGELDDWNGNRFEKIYELNRSIVLPSSVIRHFVPCAYNCTRQVPFISAEIVNGLIELKLYDIRDEMSLISRINIQVKVRALGTKLNAEQYSGNRVIFNSYNPINEDFILSKAKWSSTLVNNTYLIIGCHVGNNYDQWSFVYNLDTKSIIRVIQGYGFVGLHGELTGGMLPNDYCDTAIGFNGTVQPLSALDRADKDLNDLDAAYEINSPDDFSRVKTMIAGTAEQQWYIQQKLYGIVSHMTFDGNGGFVKQLIPITNNYAAKYKSPSWATTVMGDMCVQVQPFASMCKFPQGMDALWQTFMGFIGYPSLYMIAPRYSYCVYLQQTVGQYAYVHYNSSKSLPEEELGDGNTDSGMSEKKSKQTDPVLSGYLTFDKQKATQRAQSENNYYSGGILAILISAFSAAAQTFEMKPSLNEEQNQSAVSDTGKKFLDNMVANTGDMLASALVTQAKTDSGVTSTVTAIKSLDMFYSTSEQQHIYAGPGFVEHQFVADCVAQSVTDTQCEGKVLQMQYIIRALTELQINITIKLELLAADALEKAANALKETSVCGTNVGGAAAAVLVATAAGLRAAAAATEMAAKELAKIMDVLCANGITVSVDAQLQRHALSAEGKHKYGEKNESFMWPCWGVNPGQLKYTDEWVSAGIKNTPWILALRAIKYYDATNPIAQAFNPVFFNENVDYSALGNVSQHDIQYNGSHDSTDPMYWRRRHEGFIDFYQASPFGVSEERILPDDMAKVEGVSSFLPTDPFKNENIGMSEPAFTPSLIQDYIIDKAWDLGQCCTYGLQQWVTCKDTKITNCAPSNMYVTGDFCGVAVPYMAMEIKRGISKEYMRPWAITPTVLAFNVTGFNSILDDKLYHSFDGLSQRIVDLVGSPGLNKNRQSYIYAFQINDRFKRSNIVPANELQGNFEADPVMAMNTIDPLFLLLTVASKQKGMEGGTVGEDKDTARWALPIFTEHVTTLPAAVKTLTAMPLNVYDGVTGLTTNLANNQTAYKAPLSVDFTIGKSVYRQTEEYICSVQTQGAIDVVTELVPSLGLKFIGATPTEAYFYSKATRCYYMFSGGSSLTKMDMMERFRDIQKGYWDFVNQEVIMPCLMTFKRLNPEVLDKDSETDNIIVPVLSKAQVSGELIPPITTIFNDRSWYKVVSLPSGLAYQGPNRVIINRNVFVEYMLDSIKSNYGKWKKMDREKYVTKREYPEIYKDVVTDVHGVDGWTHNPFLLVTSALGQSEDTDCVFEWTLTFCWPIEMDLLYGVDNYAVVNVMAETMTPGGKRQSRPTHIFLTKELFTRDGNYGYYSIKFQSKNGAGNRERLHIWSDQYIAISSIDCEAKGITSNRTAPLTQQLDVEKLKEL